MNHLDSIDSTHQQTEFPQRLIAAILTIIFAGLIFYGVPYLAYETTIKRTAYEVTMSLIPTKFIRTFEKAAAGFVSRSGMLPHPHLTERQNSTTSSSPTSQGSGVLSVIQRARALSGFDTLVDKTQEQTFSGLGNWDNSCYQNSVLQGLASLPAFRTFVEKSWYMCELSGVEARTIGALQVFVNQLLEETLTRRTLWPPSILKSMDTWQQQDAQEYLSKIMDAIDKESARYYQILAKRRAPGLDSLRQQNHEHLSDADAMQHNSETPALSTLPRNPLDGILSQILRCQTCGFSEGLFLMPFNCLTLNLGLGGNCCLEDLLDAYTDPELIEGVECEECTKIAHKETSDQIRDPLVDNATEAVSITPAKSKSSVLSTKAKQILFGRLPQDLVIHINRSIFDNYGNQRKNTSLISFPPRLDIVNDWVASLGLITPGHHGSYELKCTVTHSGRHDNGHYVAYGKRGKEWYSFNDETVTKVLKEQVLDRGNVFLLFYELIHHDALIEVDVSQTQTDQSEDGQDINVASIEVQEDGEEIIENGLDVTNPGA